MADSQEQVSEVLPQADTMAEPESAAERSSAEAKDANVEGEDEASRLRALAADVRDQDDLERDVGRQV